MSFGTTMTARDVIAYMGFFTEKPGIKRCYLSSREYGEAIGNMDLRDIQTPYIVLDLKDGETIVIHDKEEALSHVKLLKAIIKDMGGSV